MKQYLLAGLIVLAFIAYAVHQKLDDGETVVVSPPPMTTVDNTTSTTTSSSTAKYKDGTYTGDVIDAYYGNIQVSATISGGKITDVQFLQYPNDRRESVQINSQAMPYLKSEAIQVQSANVNIVSGATQTSQAFQKSLQTALSQAS